MPERGEPLAASAKNYFGDKIALSVLLNNIQSTFKMFNSIRSKLNQSQEKLREAIAQYIIFHKDTKQLILTPKTVGLLCQQAQAKIENISHLEPDLEAGLIATIQHNDITAKLHFTPDKITIKEHEIEGQLLLLNSPKYETDSLIYRYLIAGWQSFLGGKIPEQALPKGVRVEQNYIYYTFPREDAKLLNIFFPILKTDSVLNMDLKQGTLIIDSTDLSFNPLKIPEILQLLQVKISSQTEIYTRSKNPYTFSN